MGGRRVRYIGRGYLRRQGQVPLFEFLNSLDATLRIGNHFTKEVGEAGLADLGGLGAVQRAMVDGLAIAR